MTSNAGLPSIEEAGGKVGWVTTADGTRVRWARFDVEPPRAAVLFLLGFTEFIEKHLETISDLKARGYRVLTLDWRGQGLSDRTFADRHKGHVASMDLFLSDLEQVMSAAGFEDWSDRRIVLGHSMGGHLALRAAHDRPELFERIVALAPMAGVALSLAMRFIAPGLARVLVALGLGSNYAPGAGGSYDESRRRFEGNMLTRDERRFRRMHDHIDAEPDLAIGAPTVGWIQAAFRSMALAGDPAYCAAIRRPVLLTLAGEERIVSNDAIRRLAGLLPDCRLIEFPGARHELLGEIDEVRDRLWCEIDRFLEEGMKRSGRAS